VTTLADRRSYTFERDAVSLWRAISDGDAFERDVGLPRVRYRFEPDENGARDARAEIRLGSMSLSWAEPSCAWEAPRRISVERRFPRGPIARYTAQLSVVADDDEDTRVEHNAELEARNAVGALLARPLLAYVRWRVELACRRAARRAASMSRAGAGDDVPVVPAATIFGVARFVDACEALRSHTEDEPAIAARLAALLEHAPRASLRRLRPHELADAWHFPHEDVTAAMLAAAHADLLSIAWMVICPRCRVPRAAFPTLGELLPTVQCEICQIMFTADFDRNVELAFAAPSAGNGAHAERPRALRPSDSRQIVAQRALGAATVTEIEVDLGAGAYVVQVLPDRVARFTVESDAGSATLAARIEPARVIADASVVRAGSVRLQVTNVSARDVVVRVVEAPLARTMATAARVTALQAFRDLFCDDVLAGDAQGTIRSLTFVCADVVGLDRIVAELGDAQVARRVRAIAVALREVIAACRGALVKSTGDGVTAVFAEPRDAVDAALRFAAAAAPLELRVGLHRGPCVAVTANGRLDYVGATVSTTARLTRTARPGELLLTDAVADDAQVAGMLPPGDRGVVTLRGVPQPIDVTRLRSAAVAAAR
jgi:class 3 adenylate cyclase